MTEPFMRFWLLHSIRYGLLLSLLMTILILAAVFLNKEIMLRSYPPDIKEKYVPIGLKARRQMRWLSLLSFIIWAGILCDSVRTLAHHSNEPLSFGTIFWSSFLLLNFFNLVDLLVLDWLIFVTIQPDIVILPGTKGLEGYKDYVFHGKGFLKGIVLISIVSLAVEARKRSLQN